MSPAERGGGGRNAGRLHRVGDQRRLSACLPTFDLTSSVSSGWTAFYSAGAMTLSPGATASSTLTVISAAGAANAAYGVVATAKNRGATTYAASDSATYVVSTPCTRANPAVSLSPSQSSGVASGTAVAFTLSVTNSDSSACAASSFTLTNAVPRDGPAVSLPRRFPWRPARAARRPSRSPPRPPPPTAPTASPRPRRTREPRASPRPRRRPTSWPTRASAPTRLSACPPRKARRLRPARRSRSRFPYQLGQRFVHHVLVLPDESRSVGLDGNVLADFAQPRARSHRHRDPVGPLRDDRGERVLLHYRDREELGRHDVHLDRLGDLRRRQSVREGQPDDLADAVAERRCRRGNGGGLHPP